MVLYSSFLFYRQLFQLVLLLNSVSGFTFFNPEVFMRLPPEQRLVANAAAQWISFMFAYQSSTTPDIPLFPMYEPIQSYLTSTATDVDPKVRLLVTLVTLSSSGIMSLVAEPVTNAGTAGALAGFASVIAITLRGGGQNTASAVTLRNLKKPLVKFSTPIKIGLCKDVTGSKQIYSETFKFIVDEHKTRRRLLGIYNRAAELLKQDIAALTITSVATTASSTMAMPSLLATGLACTSLSIVGVLGLVIFQKMEKNRHCRSHLVQENDIVIDI